MKKKINKRKVIKLLLFAVFTMYFCLAFLKQQVTLSAYKREKEYVASQIKQQSEYKESLLAIKDNVNSPEYIEQIARDKLNMFLPNERVYIDVGN